MTFTFHAYHLTERLKLTSLLNLFPEKPFRASGTEVVYRFKPNQYLILHNFGSVVFFNCDPARESNILSVLQQQISSKEGIHNSEEYFLEEGSPNHVDFRKVIVDELTYERIQIVSLVLAQSVALDYYETIVNNLLNQSATFAELLESKGRIGSKNRHLLKFIGFCLNTKQKVISSTALLDNPDPTWNDPLLETLYRQMTDMFEIKERFRVLEYKLKTIQETLEILSDLSRSQRMLYLEVAVVVLIAIEILLFILERS